MDLVRFAAALLAPWLGGCAASHSVSKEELAAAEARLLSPYQQSRAVVADELVFDISANFHDEVTQPAVDPQLHELKRAVEDGDDVYRWTSRGGVQSPLRFKVGETKLLALMAATVRVRGSGKDLALSTTAAGNVSVSEDQQMHNYNEVRIEEGVLRRR